MHEVSVTREIDAPKSVVWQVLDEGGRIEEEIVDYEAGSAYTVEFTDMGDFPLKENIVEMFEESFDETLDGLAPYVETGQHEHDGAESAVASD